jgi:hypothetical protein
MAVGSSNGVCIVPTARCSVRGNTTAETRPYPRKIVITLSVAGLIQKDTNVRLAGQPGQLSGTPAPLQSKACCHAPRELISRIWADERDVVPGDFGQGWKFLQPTLFATPVYIEGPVRITTSKFPPVRAVCGWPESLIARERLAGRAGLEHPHESPAATRFKVPLAEDTACPVDTLLFERFCVAPAAAPAPDSIRCQYAHNIKRFTIICS